MDDVVSREIADAIELAGVLADLCERGARPLSPEVVRALREYYHGLGKVARSVFRVVIMGNLIEHLSHRSSRKVHPIELARQVLDEWFPVPSPDMLTSGS